MDSMILLQIGGLIGFLFLLFIIYILNEKSIEKDIKESKSFENTLSKKGFVTSKEIKFENSRKEYSLRIDNQNRKIAICDMKTGSIDIINFSELIECQILEDSNVIMQGGVGRAIIGGALAGNVGAIVGANTRKSKSMIEKLQIRIVTNNINQSLYMINIINYPVERISSIYKEGMEFANNVYATIQSIISKSSNSINVKKINEQSSNIYLEQLEKLAELKEKGIITESEFLESKQKILNKF